MAFILDDTQNLGGQTPRSLNIFTIIQVLFGGFNVQFGALFFWFGMIFTLVFVGQSELVYLFTIDGDWVETTATVESIAPAGVEVNDVSYYKFDFQFIVNGQELSGSSMGPRGTIQEGQSVPAEYCSLNTDRARIVGMTNKAFPVWVAFVLIFPLVGLIFMIIGFVGNKKALNLLKNGSFAKGKKMSVTPTNTRINNRTVFSYEFSFEVAHKPYIATCKTHLRERVEDEMLEKILYDSNDPNKNLVYDAMGAAPEIDQFGKIIQAGPLALRFILSSIIGFVINFLIFFFIFM